MKELSIITICYNEPNLEKTCESIVNQTWQDFEWIVVDGDSNEDTQQVWNKYKYRIDKFISEPDTGVYNAMNKGIRLATGEYFNFLNAGDYYLENDVLENVCRQKLDKDIIYGDLRTCTNQGFQDVFFSDVINSRSLILGTISHPSSFIKKELFDKYGLYNESYKIVSDWEKWIVFFIKHKCSYKHINLITSVFNMNGISSTNTELCNKEREEVLHKYFTEKEIEQARNPLPKKTKYSFGEQIFSVKNDFNKTHKIITILGIHIKIKKGNK